MVDIKSRHHIAETGGEHDLHGYRPDRFRAPEEDKGREGERSVTAGPEGSFSEAEGLRVPGESLKSAREDIQTGHAGEEGEEISEITDEELGKYFAGGEVKNPQELLERLLNTSQSKE